MIFWLLVNCFIITAWGCGFPGAPAHSTVSFSDEIIQEDTVATYSCDRGFELLGPSRKICTNNGTWTPPGIPFCVLNVAAGKAPMQSSVLGDGIPQKAVDGSTSTTFSKDTCMRTTRERNPWWYVNLLEPYMIQLVRLDFGSSCCDNRPAVIEVRVGNNRPDLSANPVCNRFEGNLEEGRPLFLPCSPPMPGAFVSVHFVEPLGSQLSICEAFVYTDQALPIERCPLHRDQKLGSTATYNGKCYFFHNEQTLNFDDAFGYCQSRGGSLLDETNPALQGFLSWELWRRHRGDPNGQYWMGAVRDPVDINNWKWINGKDVTISFWNLPGGNENCARFDGTKGWLWSDTNCLEELNFVCQHRPKTCGKPEQPPNSTMVANNYEVGSTVTYYCDPGHVLVGPQDRKCLNSGFFNEFPPNCQYIECGTAAPIRHGSYELLNGTKHYNSVVRYSCDLGYLMVGRSDLVCDLDGRWDGPPPRCEKDVKLDVPNHISERGDGFPLNTDLDSEISDSQPNYVTVLPVLEEEDPAFDVSLQNNKGPSIDRTPFIPGGDKTSWRASIPIGGIIAIGVFGGFVFLAAIITTIVILVRRMQGSSAKKYMRRHEELTTSSDASSTDGHGLNKYYKRAWDNLGGGRGGVPALNRDSEKNRLSKDAYNNRGDGRPSRGVGHEVLRDGSELMVNDTSAMYTRPEKKRHHHHHHHRHKDHRDEEDRHHDDLERRDRDWRDRDRRKY